LKLSFLTLNIFSGYILIVKFADWPV